VQLGHGGESLAQIGLGVRGVQVEDREALAPDLPLRVRDLRV
jgi:hypothetical protein